MYTLVVVDMQAKFDAARRTTVQDHCKRAIRKAIRNKAAIIFLEYDGQGPTLPCLTKLTREYKRAFHAIKRDWDGSNEALEVAKAHNLPIKRIRICGVYTNCCVKATVNGFHWRAKDSKLEVLHKACGPVYEEDQEPTLKLFSKMAHVRIMER